MRITAYPSLTEQQFLGCAAAFVDSLAGELNAAVLYLRKLEDERKGAAFAHEMSLDRHRYGALLVLDRWSEVVRAFGPHVDLGPRQVIVDGAPARIQAAEEILSRANRVIDAAEAYTPDVIEACAHAFRSAAAVFVEERDTSAQSAQLGPLLSDEFRQTRRIFLEDLAAR